MLAIHPYGIQHLSFRLPTPHTTGWLEAAAAKLGSWNNFMPGHCKVIVRLGSTCSSDPLHFLAVAWPARNPGV